MRHTHHTRATILPNIRPYVPPPVVSSKQFINSALCKISSKAATVSFSQQSFSQALWHSNPPSSWDIWVFKIQHILHQVKSWVLGNYLFGQFGIFWEYILTQVLDDRTRADYNGRPSAVCRVKRSCVRSSRTLCPFSIVWCSVCGY